MRILIIEDDEQIASFIVKGLKQGGFATDHATDGEEGLRLALTKSYDAAIVDIMLPKLDGLSLIETLRQQKVNTPVIILSAKRSVDDRVRGLQKGGDDYLTKPFSFSELLARLQALIRRAGSIAEPSRLTVGDISMDLLSREVVRGGKMIDLQSREFALLEYFMRNAGRVVSKTMIMEHIWSYDFDPQTNIVDVLVCRLRNKVDKDFEKSLIHTIRGVGYVFKFLERIPKTIGFKLTLWYSGILFLSSLILFALVYFTLSLSLQKKDREIILLELKECVAQYQRGGVDALQNEVEFERHASGKNPFFVRLEGPANKTIFLNTPDQWANFDLKLVERRAIKDNKHWLYLTARDSEDIFEVVLHTFPDGSLLEVGKSITGRKEFLKRFRTIFAGVTIPMIVLGFVAGAFLSFCALRPIRYLINTIRLIIDTGEMESRMPTGKRGDELDELSILFNRMLEKIETLMKGMREGLDNVAQICVLL